MNTKTIRRTAVALLTAALLVPPLLADSGLRAEIARTRAEIERLQKGLFGRYGDPKVVRALGRFWSLTQRWTSEYLDAHPRASAREIEASLRTLAKEGDLAPSVVRLTGDAAVVAIDWDFQGTVFVVSRIPPRPFAVSWDIRTLAEKSSPDSRLAAWAATMPGVHAGPLGGRVLALPPARSGRPRFLIDAIEHAGMGLEVPGQISVWEWTGNGAVQEFLGGYFTAGSPNAKLQGDQVRIRTKELPKMFYTCGSCEEPQGAWTLRVTPDGVTDLGHAFDEPLLKLVDDLMDLVAHHKDASALASPQARASLAKILAEEREEWRQESGQDEDRLGMLMELKVRVRGGKRVIDFSTDRPVNLRFTVEQRSGKPYVTAVEEAVSGETR